MLKSSFFLVLRKLRATRKPNTSPCVSSGSHFHPSVPPSLCPSVPHPSVLPPRGAPAAPVPRAHQRDPQVTGTGWEAQAQAPGQVSTQQETPGVRAEGTVLFKKQKPERFSWKPTVLPPWGSGDAPATGALRKQISSVRTDKRRGTDRRRGTGRALAPGKAPSLCLQRCEVTLSSSLEEVITKGSALYSNWFVFPARCRISIKHQVPSRAGLDLFALLVIVLFTEYHPHPPQKCLNSEIRSKLSLAGKEGTGAWMVKPGCGSGGRRMRTGLQHNRKAAV